MCLQLQADKLRRQDLFIIDEATMILHSMQIDICLQDITGVASHFGGKILLYGGDFRQPACCPSSPAISGDR